MDTKTFLAAQRLHDQISDLHRIEQFWGSAEAIRGLGTITPGAAKLPESVAADVCALARKYYSDEVTALRVELATL